MNDKTPSKRKISDVTKVQKAAASKPPQIILEKRSHIDMDTPAAPSAADTPSAPAVAPTVKRTVIAPPETSPTTDTPAATAPTDTEAKEAPATSDATTKSSPTPTPAQPEATTATPPADTKTAAPAASQAADAQKDDAETNQDADESQEALEAKKAAAVEQQQKKVDKYIDTREFFVPIDAAAHKRSVQVSLWLTLVYIILSVILVDLMLDSGMIELLQKVPHTNFFRT